MPLVRKMRKLVKVGETRPAEENTATKAAGSVREAAYQEVNEPSGREVAAGAGSA